MKICKKICLVLLSIYLISCASTNPPPESFNEFLYNQSSMTKQLRSLDDNFKVVLLYSDMSGRGFKRISSLNLKNKPVIVGVSQAKTGSPYFIDLLKNADTTPIGNILFAKNSGVSRDQKMTVETVSLDRISDNTVKTYITSLGYTKNSTIYKRTSIFRKGKEYMQVIEYILPSIHNYI